GAIVEARSQDTGALRAAPTDAQGRYRIDLLAPGPWSVTAHLGDGPPGPPRVVSVALQETATADLTLGSSGTEAITVTAAMPMVDHLGTAGELSVDRYVVQDLPINGRQITDYARLDASVRAAPSSDFYGERGSVFVINGQSGRANSFLVDGLDNNDLTSNTSLNANVSSLVVREFKLLTHQFAPEFGRASGGILNIVTRQGGNDTEGEVFAQGVSRGLSQAGDFVDALPNPEGRQDTTGRFQAGFSLGGPYRKDKAFYFLAFEHQQADEVTPFTGVGRDGIAGGRLIAPSRDDSLFFRSDLTIGGAHSLMMRLSGDDRSADGLNVGGRVTPEAGFRLAERDLQFVASLTSVLSPRLLNEGRLLVGTSAFDQFADSNRPGVERPSGIFGGNTLNRQLRDEDRLQLVDNISWQAGRHGLKFGVDAIRSRTRIDTLFNPNGSFTYITDRPFEPGDCGDLLASQVDLDHPFAPSYCTGDPNGVDDDGDGVIDEPGYIGTYPQVFQLIDGHPQATVDDTRVALFAQDSWEAGSRWVLNYGLRYDLSTYHLPSDARVASFIPNGGAGVDRDNLAPRFGVTFTPDAARRWVVRGGAGVFYDKIVLAFPAVAAITSGTSIGLIFPEGFTFEITENTVEQLGIDALREGLKSIPQVTLRFSTDTRLDTPYTVLYDLGVERAVGTRGAFGVNVTRALGYHQILSHDLNPVVDPNPGGLPVHLDPSTGSIAAFGSVGRSWYTGLDLQWRWRGVRNWYSVSYTLSKTLDLGPDPLRGGFYLPPYDPAVGFDLRNEKARSDADRRHRLSLAGAMRLPWLGVWASGLLQASSGAPFNITTGNDTNVDGFYTERPAGVGRNSGADTPLAVVNALRAAPGVDLPPVTRLREPTYLQVDLRLWKPFPLGGARQGEAYLQIFNLLNRVNAAVVDGTVTSRTFGQPIALAGPPLTLEMGLRVQF
ncbi:MAG TPA: TonB-dependent receptor, partial [Candidatus Polarisedimenticolia bacterium]|nr:TonB-dependent receptor [Candidatus Polarisedimenticolia bacterium]